MDRIPEQKFEVARLLTATTLIATLGFITNEANAETFNPALSDKSHYTLNQVEQDGNNVISGYTYDEAAKTTTQSFWQVGLKDTSYGQGSNSINVNIPNSLGGGNFTLNAIYGDSHSRYDGSNLSDINADFVGLTGFTNGGAINSSGTVGDVAGNFINNTTGSLTTGGNLFGGAINASAIGNIDGNFINNTASSANTPTGGAITLQGSSDVGYIKGNFFGNKVIGGQASSGGAIEIARVLGTNATIAGHDTDIRPQIDYIEGQFVGNYASGGNQGANGGAIDFAGDTERITADFIGNYTSATGSGEARGGAIYGFCSSTINDIQGDFIANHASGINGTASAVGGALYFRGALNNWKNASVGTINSNFIGNYASSVASSARGGAIYNAADIEIITGEFQGNYATSNNGTVQGGAIYNTGHIGQIINAKFLNNYVYAAGGNAEAGAIYSTSDLNILADNYDVVFSGNWARIGNGATRRQAITMATQDSILNLETKNKGRFIFDDQINGSAAGYEIRMSGDSASEFVFNNTVSNANVTFNDGTLKINSDTFASNDTLNMQSGRLNVLDDHIESYTINKLISNQNARYSIDVNIGQGGYSSADRFILNDKSSSGTVFIDTINWAGNITPQAEFKVPVLNTNGNNSIQIALADALKTPEYYIGRDSRMSDDLSGTISWDGKFHDITEYGDKYGSLDVGTTNTTNDSIALVYKRTEWDGTYTQTEKDYTLSELNAYELKADEDSKNFNAKTYEDIYNVKHNLGNSTEGVFNINGVSRNSEQKSTIVLGQYEGFKLVNDTIMNITNAALKGDNFISVSNKDAVINLNNAYIDSSQTGSNSNVIVGASHLNIIGQGTMTSIYGNVKDTNATLTDATLRFSENTFKDSNSSLDVQSGRVRAENGKVENYIVNKLTSSTNAAYSLDIDVKGMLSDNFNVSDNTSSGTVYIDTLTIVEGTGSRDDIDKDFKVQVLNTNGNSALQIALSEELKNRIYATEAFGDTSNDLRGTIGWSEKYHDFYDGGVRYITLTEGKTATDNDSIVAQEHVSYDEHTVLERDNTLTQLVKYELKADEDAKNFNASSASDVYVVNDNLGSMTEGIFNINGVSTSETNKSTIEIGNRVGFILDKETTFNINDTKLTTNNNPIISITNENAIVNLKNAYINGNIAGTVNFDLNILGKNTVTYLNGFVVNANATLNDATLKLGVTNEIDHSSNVLRESVLTAVSGKVDTVDNLYTNYTIKELQSSADVTYDIDMILNRDTQMADTFTVGENSSGTIKLSGLKNVTNNAKFGEKYILQIIKTNTQNGTAPQLTWDGATVLKGASAVMSTDDELKAGVGLFSKDTLNDSIIMRGDLDTLAEWMEFDTKDDKQFTLKKDYELSRSIDEIRGENVEIVGGNNTLNVSHNKFLDSIEKGTNVKISDLEIENSNTINNKGGLDLTDVVLPVNIRNDGTLTLNNTTKVGNIVNNSILNTNNAHKDLVNNIAGENGTWNITNSDINQYGVISGQKIVATDTTLTLYNPSSIINDSMSLNNSHINIPNLGTTPISLQTFDMTNSDITIGSISVNLLTQTMGSITANEYGATNGTITIKDLNIINDSKNQYTEIKFTDKNLADKVKYEGQSEYYSALSKYDVTYLDKNGHFLFSKADTGRGFGGFNPEVFAAPVASQAGAYSAMNETINHSFEHSDVFMVNPEKFRQAAMKSNQYSISELVLPYQANQYKDFSSWIRPYATFETIPLKNGPKVNTINYGTLVGLNGNMKTIGDGWSYVPTVYLAYNGSNQTYNNIHTNQNGGLFGVTQTFYKKNFFNALTANAGAMVGQSSLRSGSDEFVNIMSGIANKMGWNMEFKEGKFIVQPSALVAYSFIDTLDYTTSSGIRVNSRPLHTIQINPSIKFISNTKNGWQPYASVGMVWNAVNKTQVTANSVTLPELSVKPYVEYGFGIQKRLEDKLTIFGQAMARSGGRNGVALNFGIHFAVGKLYKPTEHVKKNPDAKERKTKES